MGFSEDAAKHALEAHGSTGGALDALLGLVPHHPTQAKFISFLALLSSVFTTLLLFFCTDSVCVVLCMCVCVGMKYE